MPGFVEPNIDAYGTYARSSALADYLEVAAVSGDRVTRDDLKDIVEESSWTRRPRRQFIVDEPEEDPDTWVEATFGTIAERANILGNLYPFEERGRALRLKNSERDLRDDRYISLLAIAVVHAFGVSAPVEPEAVLEDVAARTLEGFGLAVARMGTSDRSGADFTTTLLNGATSLGLQATDAPRPLSKRAKDAGVDTLAGLVFPDRRGAGQWVFIGQVTVGSSDSWKKKLAEPEPPRWAGYLQEPLPPQSFLVVPHHVEREHLVDLLASKRGLIIDRLRIVPGKGPNSDEERQLIEAITAVPVDQ